LGYGLLAHRWVGSGRHLHRYDAAYRQRLAVASRASPILPEWGPLVSTL
jgi:hypothetical protein